ncbi:DALR anticodon-binding domain-containing protein 3-like isoform X1 [Stylophora pistillata]|uniref:DALR anticodon-binding domain-containing protein 3-like isoform X1 n=1 Tax=Stylophora pistillata TaxID=50429 RepID=UPI000C039CD8|nr:DALR anticodon-binding domain-containing protein 3-like isoform X1 [Stylophora pistillata]
MVIKRCRASGPTYEPLRGTIAKTIDNMADGEFEGLYEGNFVNNGKTEFSDLLPYMKRLVCEALSTVDSLNQTNFDSCFLKLNKKLENGDLIIPAFVRNYLGEGKVEFQSLCQRVIHQVTKVQFVRQCCVTSGGHLLLSLYKSDLTSAVFNNIVKQTDQYGQSSKQTSQSVLLNPSMSVRVDDEGHLNLDQMRTVLICEHIKELLNANSINVISALDYKSQPTCTCKDGSIWGHQETYNLFSLSSFTSKEISLWTEKDLTAKAKELYKILKCCKYVDSLNKKTEMQATDEAEPSCNYLCKSDCTCKDSDLNCDAVILDLPNFCKDNELLSVTPNKLSVSPTSSILLDVAKLDLAEKSIGDIDMVVHLTSCRLAFSQQQMSTVWQMTATNPAKMRQFFVSHGLVSLYKDEQKLHDHLDFLELLRTREKQLRESYIVKYGNKVEGCGWDKSLREMAVAVIKLEILSSAPNSEVKINISETSRQFRQATFVLYNCARLAKLFASFEEFVQKGVYPALPPVTEVDFRLLRDQAEWELTLHYIVAFPSVIKDAVAGLTVFKSKSQNVTIQSNKICCFLLNLSHKFSSYYGRVHVLGVSDIELKREICLLYFPSF